MKAELAIRWTIERWEEVYMWTFTFPVGVYSAKEIFSRWRAIYQALGRAGKGKGQWTGQTWRGIRVWEWHPGGHGIHLHVATPDRHDVVEVRRICWANDGRHQRAAEDPLALCGRIDVRQWFDKEKAGRYLAKYLVKQKGDGRMPKGTRQWAAFRLATKTRCKDVVIESPLTLLYRKIEENGWWDRLAGIYGHGPVRRVSFRKLVLAKRLLMDPEREAVERFLES